MPRRADLSVTRAADRIEYAETGARHEDTDLVAPGVERLADDELPRVADAFAVESLAPIRVTDLE